MITQLTFFLVIVLLFAVYKTISRCLRHREKKMKIEKGIVGTQGKDASSAKWIRSIYIAAPLLIASSVSIAIVFLNGGGLDLSGMQFVFCVMPFCVGIAYLIRGILKRKSYIRRLCLNNGVPLETVYPPQKQWIFPLSLGLPLLIYGVTLLTLGIVYNFGDTILLISVLVASVLGGMFFLYGLLMFIVMSRRKAKTVSPQTTSTNRDVIADEHHEQETS
jgi:hypothetical protein